jgi:membrane protein
MTIYGRITEATQARPWRIVRRALDEFSLDRIPSVAAAITFFFLLAMFPALACVVSIYGIFADRSTIVHELNILSGFMPEGAVSILRTDIDRLAALPAAKFNLGFLTALALAIWSASGGIKALIEGLDVAYETKETRSFFRFTLSALMLTFVAIVFAVALIEFAVTVPPFVARLPFDNWLSLFIRIFVWPAIFVACVLLASLIYRYGPNRAHAKWRWFTWGGAFASGVWMAGTFLFSWYVSKFGHYNEMYGNLGAIVGFLTWIWLSLVVLLLGAEINCEIEREEAGRQPIPRARHSDA